MATATPVPTRVSAASGRVREARRQWSFPIFAVRGIQLRIHISFVVLVALLAWLASIPGGPGALAALAWIGMLFGSVILHEFAHSLVALRRGIAVHEILLLPIGGISKLESLPERWNDEFVISIVGPLTSLALGVIGLTTAWFVGEPMLSFAIGGSLLAAFGWMNLILGTFNLLPAFPLDGGRVLRALLERRHDRATATRWAARIGRWFAITMMLVGVLFDWWLILIGMFVYFGATAEERATLVHLRLAPLHVRDAFVEVPVTFAPDQRAGAVALQVMHALQPVFPLVDADGYRGAATYDALLGAPSDATCAASIDESIPVVDPGDPLEDAMELVLEAPGEAAVVVAGRAVVGILRAEDLRRLLATPPITPGQRANQLPSPAPSTTISPSERVGSRERH